MPDTFMNDGTVRNAAGGIVGLWSGYYGIKIDPDELMQPVRLGMATVCRKCCRVNRSPGATCKCEGYEPDLSRVIE